MSILHLNPYVARLSRDNTNCSNDRCIKAKIAGCQNKSVTNRLLRAVIARDSLNLATWWVERGFLVDGLLGASRRERPRFVDGEVGGGFGCFPTVYA